MKKFVAIIITLAVIISILGGCSDFAGKELKNFHEVEMTSIYNDFKEIKSEADKWKSLKDDDKVVKNIRKKQIPALEKIVEKVSDIDTDTRTVKNLKKKYIEVIKLHMEGYEFIAKGVDALEQDDILKGLDLVKEGEDLLQDYHYDIEALAEKYKLKIK